MGLTPPVYRDAAMRKRERGLTLLLFTVFNAGIAKLTEVFECFFDLLGGQVKPGAWCDEGSVQPIIVVVAVDGVGPQTVNRKLLLQKTDDLELWQISAVAHI